ncbi:MAG: RNA polymerase factor sigma-32 [Deltaproteobacteria bacterium]|nr:RNA polymerase factor sigma-32 [Deltaproteobacteria bacterium]
MRGSKVGASAAPEEARESSEPVRDPGDELEVEFVADEEPEPVDPKADAGVFASGVAPVQGRAAAGDEPGKEEQRGALVTYDPLQRYLQEIRRYALLSREEEHALAVRYRTEGDVEAAYKLVTGNLRLVVMIAREYQRSFRNLLDLVQEGNIGLMEAVKNFDPYRGVRFPSYAVWWIRAYVIRYVINNWRMVKLGTTQAQRKLFFNLQKEKDRLEREGFVAAPKLLADRLGVKEKEVVEMQQRLAASDFSVDTPLREGEDTTMLDVLRSDADTVEEVVADAEFRRLVGARIREFGQTLKDKDRVIFDHRLLAEDPMTLQEIGDRYGISRERVRQIENRVKRKLRAHLEEHFPDLRGVDLSYV